MAETIASFFGAFLGAIIASLLLKSKPPTPTIQPVKESPKPVKQHGKVLRDWEYRREGS